MRRGERERLTRRKQYQALNSERMTKLTAEVADEMMRETGNPVVAIIHALCTAAFNSGLVHPMHITLMGNDGQSTEITRLDDDLIFECTEW